MLSCFKRGGKCEWEDGNLKSFVRQYNAARDTTYRLADCLDAPGKQQTGQKQPEVLVTGERGETPMVIERKVVVWPQSYIKHHLNQHQVYDIITERLLRRFHDDLYCLVINDESLRDKSTKLVQAAAHEIVDRIIGNEDSESLCRISGSSPFPWSFGRVPDHLREDDAPERGVGIVSANSQTFGDAQEAIRRRDVAYLRTEAMLEKHLLAASPKFTHYHGHSHVVVLEFYGDGELLDETDIERMVAKAGRIIRHIEEERGGKLNSSEFGQRMKGTSEGWKMTEKLFKLYCRRLGFEREERAGHAERNSFRCPSSQGSLFE